MTEDSSTASAAHKRRLMLFHAARTLVVKNLDAFREAGAKLDDFFDEDRGSRHKVHRPQAGYEMTLARLAALGTAVAGNNSLRNLSGQSSAGESDGGWFDFRANVQKSTREFHARIFLLAVLICGDPDIDETEVASVSELASVRWDDLAQGLGRSWMTDWSERAWEREDAPSPALMELFEDALRLLESSVWTVEGPSSSSHELISAASGSTPNERVSRDGETDQGDLSTSDDYLSTVQVSERGVEVLRFMKEQPSPRTRTYISANAPMDIRSARKAVNELKGLGLVEDRGKHTGIAITDRGRDWLSHSDSMVGNTRR